MLSLLQLLIYAVLARQGTRSVLPGVGRAGRAAGHRLAGSTVLYALLLVVAAVDTALFLTLLAISLHRLRLPVTGEEPPPEALVTR